jgi:ribonuclease Z
VWGPSGPTPELGTKHFIDNFRTACHWDLYSRIGRRPEEPFEIVLTEFDYTAENAVVYEENGVTIRSWPAIHAVDGPVSYSLEWNGLKFVYGGDTGPNKWHIEYAKDADLIIHECFITVELLMEKFGFSRENAIQVGTQVHTSPEACGKVFSLVNPRHAIAYHFYNDFETDPPVYLGLRKYYKGELSLAKDLMVWNVTKDNIVVRNCVPNMDSWPVEWDKARPLSELTWKQLTPMSDWLEAGRLGWPGVDEFD